MLTESSLARGMLTESSLAEWCSLHGGLDSVRYISMPKEEARRAKSLAAFSPRFPTALRMVDAVNGRDLDPGLEGIVDSVSWFTITHKLKSSVIDNLFTIGAVGCAQSHRAAIRAAAQASGCTLILESDMSGVADGVWQALVKEMPVLPAEVDVVWLNSHSGRGNGVDTEWRGLERVDGMLGGTGAILYTPSGARKLEALLARSDAVNARQVDTLLGAIAARYPDDILMLRAKDNVITYDVSSFVDSSIQLSNVKPYLPASNWFYIGFVALLASLIAVTAVLGRRLVRQRRLVVVKSVNAARSR